MQLIHQYEGVSGQRLNCAKTAIFFSKNTGAAFRGLITSSVRASATTGFERYLGLPAMVGRAKKQAFASIHSRVQKKLEGYKERFLSQAGKEILIKAVVQAIPTYSMGVFKLPKSLCKSLNFLSSRFWWGSNQNSPEKCLEELGQVGGSKKAGRDGI